MVRDDGKGLPEEVVESRTDSVGVGVGVGVGVEGMRQRSKELGARFRLSNTNPGTLLEVIIP